MKIIGAFFLALVLASSTAVQAAEVCIELPSAAVQPMRAICEAIRLELHVRAIDWGDAPCAKYLFTLGTYDANERIARRVVRATVRDYISDEIDAYKALLPFDVVLAICGDGVLDAEFNEECDDGNVENGDGCSQICAVEP